jgi:esterase/lipase superfamily enzyme
MQKQAWTWTTPRFPAPVRMARWGHFGAPVMLFPTAGGPFEELEQFHLIDALGQQIDQGRIKVYSVDGLCARTWLSPQKPQDFMRLRESYDSFLYEDVLQRIREDCQDFKIEPLLAGASLGASLAVGTLCNHPDAFRGAIGVSGLYGLSAGSCADAGGQRASSLPLGNLGGITGSQLERLRKRSVVLGSGEGDYEDPTASRRLSEALSALRVPCRLSLWGAKRDHTWSTWCEMLPALVAGQLQEPPRTDR